MKTLWILGPGNSVSHYTDHFDQLKDRTLLAYQRVFPNCYTYYNLIPSYWTGFDPNALVEGLEFLTTLDKSLRPLFMEMELVLPHFCAGGYRTFRQYCGTTPLGRSPAAWKNYQDLVQKTKDLGYNVTILQCYTTKNIELEEKYTNPQFRDTNIFQPENEYLRFMTDKPIFGTIEFDSESVIGSRYKWGLENKLSVQAFPLAYALGYKDIYVAGFDLVGSRFYDDNEYHPWDDERQTGQDVKAAQQIPLKLIEKWVDWKPLHGMNIYSVVEDQYTLVNEVLPYKPFEKALTERKIIQ